LGLLLGVIGLIIVAVSPRVDNEWQQDYEANKGIADSYARINEETVKKATAADELKKWYDLKEAGAITDAEYESKKSNIMK